jgi:hypothetical protein
MEYELIVPFQFHVKSFTCMLSQKTLRWGFSFKQEWFSWKTNYWKITFIWNIIRIMWKVFISKSIYMFTKTLNEIKKKNYPQNNTKCINKIIHFLCLKWPFYSVLSLLMDHGSKKFINYPYHRVKTWCNESIFF